MLNSTWLLLTIVLAVAGGLRFYHIAHDSMWLDEFLAVQNSTGRGQEHVRYVHGTYLDPAPALTRVSDGPGFWRIWTSLKTDTHPPLYFMALNGWRHIFGHGDASSRSLSTAFSLVAIVLAFDIARLLHGRSAGLWTALIMALAGAQIQYAQEARSYTMALALVLAAADAIVRIERCGGVTRERIAALALSILALPLTQYLAVGGAAALFLYALVRLRGRERRIVAGTFVAAAIVFAVVWGPFFIGQFARFDKEHDWQTTIARADRAGHLMLTLRRLAILPLRYFTDPTKRSLGVGHLSGVMYALPLLVMIFAKRRDLLLWILLAAGAIVPVTISDLTRPAGSLALVRYTFIASVAAYALAAAMLAHLPSALLRHAVPLVLAVACVLAIEEPYSIDKADSRPLARFVTENVSADDLLIVYVVPEDSWLSGAMYLGLAHYEAPKSPVVFLAGPPNADELARIREARRIWVMSPTMADHSGTIFPAGGELRQEAFFPWVGTIARVEPRFDPPATTTNASN